MTRERERGRAREKHFASEVTVLYCVLMTLLRLTLLPMMMMMMMILMIADHAD
jgi:hypothetical protein